MIYIIGIRSKGTPMAGFANLKGQYCYRLKLNINSMKIARICHPISAECEIYINRDIFNNNSISVDYIIMNTFIYEY